MPDLSKAEAFIMSSELMHMSEDELAHHGVLGQKWGVRKDRGHVGERTTTRRIAKLDKKYDRGTNRKQTDQFRTAAAMVYNKSDIPRINNKPKYRDVDFYDPANAAIAKEYYREHGDAYERRLNEAVKTLGTNASGTKEYKVIMTDKSDEFMYTSWYVTTTDVKHEDEDDSFYVQVETDGQGVVTGLGAPTETLAHAVALDFLAHYGILGQRWGHRKPESIARETREERHARNTRQKLAVGTLGGSVAAKKIAEQVKKKREAERARNSNDHNETRALLKAKPRHLSNQEMDRIIQRLQKEEKLSKLNPDDIARGKKLVLGLVAAAGTGITIYNMANSPAGKAAIANGQKFVESLGLKIAETIVKYQ